MNDNDQEELGEEEKMIFSLMGNMGPVRSSVVGIKLIAISMGFAVKNEEELQRALDLVRNDIETHSRKMAKDYADNPNFQ